MLKMQLAELGLVMAAGAVFLFAVYSQFFREQTGGTDRGAVRPLDLDFRTLILGRRSQG